MKKTLLFSTVISLALTGCLGAQNKADNTDTSANQKEPEKFESVVRIAYQCDYAQGKKVLEAAYGIVGGKIVAAQLAVDGSTSPALLLVPDAPNSDTQNTFFGNGFTWVTELLTPEKLGYAKGIILSRRQMTEVNGKQVETDATMLRGCVFDQAATKAMAERDQKK